MLETLKKLKRKFKTMKGYEGDERIMFEFILRGFAKSKNWDKVKAPLSLRMNVDEYSICCDNTTHMMNALKEARMKSREMLLSIHHSLKMLLEIISKMNRKLKDEKIKRNDKGKEKVNDFYKIGSYECLNKQEHFEGNALDPWIPLSNKGEMVSILLFYKDINLPSKDQDPAFLI
nr:hypothetical protein [Tanacetum cinerariifolium]